LTLLLSGNLDHCTATTDDKFSAPFLLSAEAQASYYLFLSEVKQYAGRIAAGLVTNGFEPSNCLMHVSPNYINATA
jgi:hypothetical protein